MSDVGAKRPIRGWKVHAMVSTPVVALLVTACQWLPGDRAHPAIILVSLDTLRADHLHCYGYPRETSPAIDAFATTAVRFDDASAQATGTLPSHLSLLTSLNPPQFRITRDDGANGDQMRTQLHLPDAALSVAEVLRDAGYDTAAFTDGGFVGARYGTAQGFDVFGEASSDDRGLRLTIPRVAAYLKGRAAKGLGGKPLFLFVHTYDVHAPYSAPEPFDRWFSMQSYDEVHRRLGYEATPENLSLHAATLTASDIAEVRALYDNGVRAVDDAVKELFALLGQHDLYDDAVVVITSDHGEEFMDHGGFNHGRTVYQELVHVPLLVRAPGGRNGGRLVGQPVALVDIGPTILELGGIDVPPQFQGRSLVPLMEGSSDDNTVPSPGIWFESPNVARGVHGLRSGSWKIIRTGRDGPIELYDLASDKLERVNRAETNADVRDSLTQELDAWHSTMEESARSNGWEAVSSPGHEPTADQIEALRALGYLQ